MTGRTVRAWAAVPALLVAAAATSGCGSNGPKLYPVEGKVTLKDGTPVKYGHVILHPDTTKGNASQEVCQGTIRDGVYVIQTGAREGALPGAYRVTIEAGSEVDPNNPYFTEWFADEKYANQDTAKLTLDVIENPEPGRYDFKLDPNPLRKKPGFLGTGLEEAPGKDKGKEAKKK